MSKKVNIKEADTETIISNNTNDNRHGYSDDKGGAFISEQSGFSPRNLKYMRKFAQCWPDETIVQRSVAQLSWRHNICLMEKVAEPNRRLIYAKAGRKKLKMD